jgi:hypothetical protein
MRPLESVLDAAGLDGRTLPVLALRSGKALVATGDVRHGSVTRVASAVGAGRIAVQLAPVRRAELERATTRR